MDKKTMTISLKLNSQQYTLTITPEEEEIVRAAGAKVNKLITEVSKQYEGIDEVSIENILTLVAYQSVLNELKTSQKNATQPFTDKLKELELSIDSIIAD